MSLPRSLMRSRLRKKRERRLILNLIRFRRALALAFLGGGTIWLGQHQPDSGYVKAVIAAFDKGPA